jgi:serine/threonine-protein kinase
VAAAVAASLEKLPADRFESARAFRDALTNPAFHPTVGTAAALRPGVAAVSRRTVLAVAGAAAVLLAAALWGWLRPPPTPPVTRYGLALPRSAAMVSGSPAPVSAPDGSFLIYVGPGAGTNQLWMKRRDSYAPIPIPGTVGVQTFALSPDGKSIAVALLGQIRTLPVVGGTPVPLVSDGVGGVFGVAWLDDGTIVYVTRGATAMMRVSADGGTPSPVWQSDSMIALAPAPIPGSRGVIFSSCLPGCPEPQLWVADLKTQSARMLLRDASLSAFVRPGALVYTGVSGAFFAVGFDPDRLELRGAPVPLGDQLSSGSLQPFSLSLTGTLITVSGAGGAGTRRFEMVWVDRNGRETPVDTGWTFRLTAVANNHGWALSPDGSKVAIGLSEGTNDDIWVKPLPRGAPYRVSYDPLADFRPRWTPDGRFVTFVTARTPGGFYRHRADGIGADSLLLEGVLDEAVLSPDGGWIVLRQGAVGAVAGGRNVTALRVGTDTAPRPLIASEFDEEAVALSPDGKWIAYQSDETGRTEIFVRPFPDTDAGKRQVSSGGGVAPLWSRDGRELFYLSSGDDMMAVRVAPGAMLDTGDPTVLFHVRRELLAPEATYYTPWDVAADGRFLMVRGAGGDEGEPGAIVVAEHWVEELKAKMRR